MAGAVAVWNGSESERNRLMAALARNCNDACKTGKPCAAHSILTAPNSQKTLDHMLFVFRIRDRLILQEMAE